MRPSRLGVQSRGSFDYLAKSNLIYTDEKNCGSVLDTVEAYVTNIGYKCELLSKSDEFNMVKGLCWPTDLEVQKTIAL